MSLKSPGGVFVVQVIYGLALGIAAFLYFTQRQFIPFAETLGPVPLAVPWFGALGGVLISLVGITEHQSDWDNRYWYWHLSRPFVGAALGVVSVIIFQAGILAVGSTPQGMPSVPRNLLYYLIAFLVGYREETFRELIKRLTDVILGSTKAVSGAPMAVTSVSPGQRAAAGGDQVDILGSGFVDVQRVTFGGKTATFTVMAPSHIVAIVPAAESAGPAVITVHTKNGSVSSGLFNYT
jgi:hypothetical protein